VELATSPLRLAEIRQRLRENRLTTPLFDAALFTKHLEQAYWQIYQRYQAGLRPAHLFIGA
jgi:protein O-GlcNAc transferase